MSFANLVMKFLRLGPIGLAVIAVAILGLGYFLQVKSNELEVTKAAALVAGPPDAVNIGAFTASQHAGPLDEVAINAQPVYEHAYRLTMEKDGPDDHVFMVPLASTTATSDTEILGVAYFPSPSEDFENITPEFLVAGAIGFGAFGPLITYNGELGGMGQWDDLTEESFFDEGLAMPDNPIVIWPYEGGREVALAPRAEQGLTIFGVLSKLAGLIGLFAIAKIAFRPQTKEDVEPEAFAEPAQVAQHGLMDDESYMGQVDEYEIPEDIEFDPEPAVYEAEAEALDELAPRRRGFPIRKALIGVIGVAFMVLGAAVAMSPAPTETAADASAASQAVPQVATPEQVVDASNPPATDAVSMVLSVLEWGLAKLDAAAAGDITAIVMIALIGVAVMIVLFFLRNVLANRKGSGNGMLSHIMDAVTE